jgi:hypothetical protein
MGMSDTAISLGYVDELYRYPVKSMQGLGVSSFQLNHLGIDDDRSRALIDVATGKLMSAKRWSKILCAVADDVGITLPDGTQRPYGAADLDEVLSSWLGREVALRHVEPDVEVSYEMTFDPPNDEADMFEIPAPPGSFLDLAPLHLVSRQTLQESENACPELNWDVRRFRPNLVVDASGLVSFGEDAWCGRSLRIGSAIVEALQPTVRCAMPLRAQPGLEAQPSLFKALDDIHANHLGIYLSVVTPGEIKVGDGVEMSP